MNYKERIWLAIALAFLGILIALSFLLAGCATSPTPAKPAKDVFPYKTYP